MTGGVRERRPSPRRPHTIRLGDEPSGRGWPRGPSVPGPVNPRSGPLVLSSTTVFALPPTTHKRTDSRRQEVGVLSSVAGTIRGVRCLDVCVTDLWTSHSCSAAGPHDPSPVPSRSTTSILTSPAVVDVARRWTTHYYNFDGSSVLSRPSTDDVPVFRGGRGPVDEASPDLEGRLEGRVSPVPPQPVYLASHRVDYPVVRGPTPRAWRDPTPTLVEPPAPRPEGGHLSGPSPLRPRECRPMAVQAVRGELALEEDDEGV